jgi:hypothetical protein
LAIVGVGSLRFASRSSSGVDQDQIGIAKNVDIDRLTTCRAQRLALRSRSGTQYEP